MTIYENWRNSYIGTLRNPEIYSGNLQDYFDDFPVKNDNLSRKTEILNGSFLETGHFWKRIIFETNHFWKISVHIGRICENPGIHPSDHFVDFLSKMKI